MTDSLNEVAAERDRAAQAIECLGDLSSATAELEAAQDGLNDLSLDAAADAIALLQDLKYRLGQIEAEATFRLGRRAGVIHGGTLSDGRQFDLIRAKDRTEWDHDAWKHDVRREVVQRHAGARVVIDTDTGEEAPLAQVLMEAITDAQNVHGSAEPKSTALKPLGLFKDNYCTTKPGGWRLSAIRPTNTTTEKD